MFQIDADGMANIVDPDQRSSLIWVCTVCPNASVLILTIITIFQTGGTCNMLHQLMTDVSIFSAICAAKTNADLTFTAFMQF